MLRHFRLGLAICFVIVFLCIQYMTLSNVPTEPQGWLDTHSYGDLWSFIPVHGTVLRMLGAVAPVLHQPVGWLIQKAGRDGINSSASQVVRRTLLSNGIPTSQLGVRWLLVRIAVVNTGVWLLVFAALGAIIGRVRRNHAATAA